MMQTVQNVGGAAARVNVWVSTYWYEKCEQDKNVNSVTMNMSGLFIFVLRIYSKSFFLCDCFPTTLNCFFNIKREERKK